MEVRMSLLIRYSTRWISQKNNLFLHMAFFQLIMFSRLVSVSLSQSEHVGYLLPACLKDTEPVHHTCFWHESIITDDVYL